MYVCGSLFVNYFAPMATLSLFSVENVDYFRWMAAQD